jgi:chemotaxis protein MotB
MSDCECVEKECEAGIPAWVMTFADLMSLLLAFFVLLFSFSEMDKNVYKELAGSLKEAFGVQREIRAKETPRGINIIAREFSPGRPKPTVHNEVRQMTTDEAKMFAVFTDASKEGQENQSQKAENVDDKSFNADREEDKVAGNTSVSEEDLAMINRIKSDSEALRKALDKEIDQGLIDMEVEDQRIILMVREKGSFPSGSADLIAPFKVIVDKISEVFSDFDGVIIVSGHTDNIPIKTYRFRSNWELSSSRAVSVIHELLKDKALKNKRFEIAAYADTKPIDTNDTPAGRARNRRVEIMMDYSDNTTAESSAKETIQKPEPVNTSEQKRR